MKTRSLAARLVAEGHVRVNSVRIEQPSKGIRAGDVVTVALERTVRVLRVLSPGERRGPAPAAQGLFEDLSGGPSPARSAAPDDAADDPGQERIRRLRHEDEPESET